MVVKRRANWHYNEFGGPIYKKILRSKFRTDAPVCHSVIPEESPAVALLVSIRSTGPLELVAIDFLHLEKASNGCEYVLLIVDHFSRFAQAYGTTNKRALTAAKKLFGEYIPRFGIPA